MENKDTVQDLAEEALIRSMEPIKPDAQPTCADGDTACISRWIAAYSDCDWHMTKLHT